GRLDRQSAELEAADRNLREDLGQAALAAAQHAQLELSELRLELEASERRWRLAQAGAAESLRMLQALAEGNRQCPALGPDGAEVAGVSVDVDHWSRGALGQLEREIADVLARVQDEAAPISEAELRAISSNATALEARLRTLVADATAAQLASQLRTNIG